MEIHQSEKLVEAINNFNKINIAKFVIENRLLFDPGTVQNSKQIMIDILSKK